MIIKMLITLFGMILALKGFAEILDVEAEFHPKGCILGLILFIVGSWDFG